uniref:RNA-directed RNA polymerase catalytic subunit n=1 Tax=Cryptocercus meridianus orthomyxovirus 2 TaxID=3133493 RepID=A0AAT9JA47_9ORTO
MNEKQDPFEEIPNSFLSAIFKPEVNRGGTIYPDKKILNSLSSISALYLYANPPPMAYGTPAPKIAETVLRSYDFNLKKKRKDISIDGFLIDNPVWENEGNFPFGEVHSNWHPGKMHLMAKNFLKENIIPIIDIAKSTIERVMTQNSDVLTKGRQTWDPITGRSVPSAQAYSEYSELLIENGLPNHHTLLGLIKLTFELMGKKEIKGKEVRFRYVKRTKTYMGQRVTTQKKQQYIIRKTYVGEEANKYVLNIIRSFCGYNKSGERAHLKRRAIASPSIPMRAFLYVVEEFHLQLGKKIRGSTISIGGDEKKMKIVETMNASSVNPETMFSLQATQDATKWNECLSASGFGMMSMTFFNNEVRKEIGESEMTKSEEIFGKICMASHFLLSLKRIYLGNGLQGKFENLQGEIDFKEKNLNSFNKKTNEWFSQAINYLDDENYLRASSGMLMGMHNAASTTLGLLSVGFGKDPDVGIYTLRSSDDSMTLYSTPNKEKMNNLIDLEDLNLQMCGINLSKKKTFLFEFSYGEYTSWYQDGKLVSQYGPETTTLRPGGNNPPDDFNNLARTTATSLLRMETNEIGAEAKLRIGVQNIRSLYLIKKRKGNDRGIRDECILLADGGPNPWNSGNCHLEETCLKERFVESDNDTDYFLKIRNPENPFATEPKEEVTWSKDAGTLTIDYAETPRTIFHYTKRTNRSINNAKGKTHAEVEKNNAEAVKLFTMADISTLIKNPTGSCKMSEHMISSIRTISSSFQLDENEKVLINEALEILKNGKIDSLSDNESVDFDFD